MALDLALPFEIIEIIIDGLIDDKASLHQCATVSQSFLLLSRKHLFSSIDLYYARKGPQPPCARLSDVLSKNPHLILCIKALHIFGGGWLFHEPTLPSLLYHIAQANRLELLHLNSNDTFVTWDRLNLPIQRALCHLLRTPTLHSLDLRGDVSCNFPIHIIATIPALAHLTISQPEPNTFRHGESEIAALSPLPGEIKGPRAALKSLKINGHVSGHLMRYLAHPMCPVRVDQLRELHYNGWHKSMGDAAGELIKAASGSLERLVWRRWMFEPLDDLNAFDLRVLARLRYIELHFACVKYFDCVERLLEHWGIPRGVEHVILVLGLESALSIHELHEWEPQATGGLDTALAVLSDKATFLHLTAVEIRVFAEDFDAMDVNQQRLYLGKWFPNVKETGCLKGGFFDRRAYEGYLWSSRSAA